MWSLDSKQGFSMPFTQVMFLPVVTRQTIFELLPNNNILDLSKLKALADDKINVTQKLKFDLGRVENIAGKGRNAGYQHFNG